MIATRPVVQLFAEQMEKVLRDNDHKVGWSTMLPADLVALLKREVRELSQRVALLGKSATTGRAAGVWETTRASAVKEAVDVANFAMFVADVLGGLEDAGRKTWWPANTRVVGRGR
jgi:hypothetical protein